MPKFDKPIRIAAINYRSGRTIQLPLSELTLKFIGGTVKECDWAEIAPFTINGEEFRTAGIIFLNPAEIESVFLIREYSAGTLIPIEELEVKIL